MSPSKHQFADVTFSIHQSGEEERKQRRKKKERKEHPQRTKSQSIVTSDNELGIQIVPLDQHSVGGRGRTHEQRTSI